MKRLWKNIFQILKKSFPNNHQFYKIFKKNTIKLNYSCTKNMVFILYSHNKPVLKPSVNTRGCNYRDRNSFFPDFKSKTPQIFYGAGVSNNFDNESKYSYCLTDTFFKESYHNHKSSFGYERYRHETKL